MRTEIGQLTEANTHGHKLVCATCGAIYDGYKACHACAEALAEARHALGWTQAQLAAILDVERLTVSRWETGARPVPGTVALVLRLAQASAKNKALCESAAQEKE